MEFKKAMELYTFLCDQQTREITVGELMERFCFQKKDIVKFLSLLQDFNENIRFYYYSPYEDEFIDNLIDIKDDTIVEIMDDFHGISLKFSIEETLKIYEILSDAGYNTVIRDKLLNQAGDKRVKGFRYITKGYVKLVDDSIREIRKTLVESILDDMVIDFKYRLESRIIDHAIPLGMYFHHVIGATFFVAEYKGCILQFRLDRITGIDPKGYRCKREFDIQSYLSEIRKEWMVLKVYPEANVLDKLVRDFSGYILKTELKGSCTIFKVKVENVMLYKQFLDSFGKSVIVIEPKRLREIMIKDARAILHNYQKKCFDIR